MACIVCGACCARVCCVCVLVLSVWYCRRAAFVGVSAVGVVRDVGVGGVVQSFDIVVQYCPSVKISKVRREEEMSFHLS